MAENEFELYAYGLAYEKEGNKELAMNYYYRAARAGSLAASVKLFYNNLKVNEKNEVIEIQYRALYWGGVAILRMREDIPLLWKEEYADMVTDWLKVYNQASNSGYYDGIMYFKYDYLNDRGIYEAHDLIGVCDIVFDMRALAYYAGEFLTFRGPSERKTIDAKNIAEISHIVYGWANDPKRAILKNPEEKYRWLKRAARYGNPFAIHQLARFYEDGNEQIPKDMKQAYYWFQKCTEKDGNPFVKNGYYKMGMILDKYPELFDYGEEERTKLICECYEKSIQGEKEDEWRSDLCFRLYQCYETGALGYAVDHKNAMKYLEISAKKCYEEAICEYLKVAEKEDYLRTRPKEFFSVILYNSFSTKNPEVKFLRGYMEEHGIGCKKHKKEAKKYYAEAAAMGHAEAAQRLKKMKGLFW